MTHTKIYKNTQYNKYTPVFHSPVNRSSQKHSVRHGDGAGNDDTRCPETSDAMFARQPAVDGLGDEGQVSEPGGSQVQHGSHGLLTASGTSRQMMSTTTRQWLVGICIEPTGCQFTNVNETVHQRLRTHTVQSAGRSPTRRRPQSRTVIHGH